VTTGPLRFSSGWRVWTSSMRPVRADLLDLLGRSIRPDRTYAKSWKRANAKIPVVSGKTDLFQLLQLFQSYTKEFVVSPANSSTTPSPRSLDLSFSCNPGKLQSPFVRRDRGTTANAPPRLAPHPLAFGRIVQRQVVDGVFCRSIPEECPGLREETEGLDLGSCRLYGTDVMHPCATGSWSVDALSASWYCFSTVEERSIRYSPEPIRVKEVMPMSSHASEGITVEVVR
jgi:hypothetical protein